MQSTHTVMLCLETLRCFKFLTGVCLTLVLFLFDCGANKHTWSHFRLKFYEETSGEQSSPEENCQPSFQYGVHRNILISNVSLPVNLFSVEMKTLPFLTKVFWMYFIAFQTIFYASHCMKPIACALDSLSVSCSFCYKKQRFD